MIYLSSSSICIDGGALLLLPSMRGYASRRGFCMEMRSDTVAVVVEGRRLHVLRIRDGYAKRLLDTDDLDNAAIFAKSLVPSVGLGKLRTALRRLSKELERER